MSPGNFWCPKAQTTGGLAQAGQELCKLNTNHGCGRIGVKGFCPYPPKAQTLHPAVCTMRAAKYCAAVETYDCSVLTIHQAPPCGHSWLVAVALRDDEGWKEQSQLTQGTQGTRSPSLRRSLLFKPRPQRSISQKFWHVIAISWLA